MKLFNRSCILLSVVCLFGCAQSSQDAEQNKVLTELLSANKVCGGDKLNLPNEDFNPEGRSKDQIFSYYACMANAVPSRSTIILAESGMWEEVFEGKYTPQQASNIWKELIKKQQNKQKTGNIIDWYISTHPSGFLAEISGRSIPQQETIPSLVTPNAGTGNGIPVYNSSSCIGAVVNGVCHGSINSVMPVATCHGQMLNGSCTGPMF